MTGNVLMGKRFKGLSFKRGGAEAPRAGFVRDPAELGMVSAQWIWEKSGLVVWMFLLMVIAVLTLTPIPTQNHYFTSIDKLYHFVAFAALIFPLILTDSRRWWWAVPVSIAFGGLIELIQPSVGRQAEWLDFGADITGVLSGAVMAEILHDFIKERIMGVDLTDGSEDADENADAKLEAMRAQLMQELREVMREELASMEHAQPATFLPDTRDRMEAAILNFERRAGNG